MAPPTFDDADTLAILEAVQASLDQGALLTYAYKYVARGWAVHPATIAEVWKRHRSTAKLATMKIQARASQIVEKIIDKAPTSELIDILSRPNIGVLEPIKSGGQGGGFIVSVSADSCGGVKMAVAGGFEPPALPVYSNKDTIDLNHLTEGESHGESTGSSHETAPSVHAESIRERLRQERERQARAEHGDGGQSHQTRDAEVRRLQGADGPPPSRSLSSPGRTSKINLRYDHESFPDSDV